MHKAKSRAVQAPLSDEETTLIRTTHSLLTEKIMCQNCNNPMKKVVSIQCGHAFCRCIVNQLKKTPQCPTCKKDVEKNVIIVNKSLTVFYEQLQEIIKQCERQLPKETHGSAKKLVEKPVQGSATPLTAARRSRRSTACKTPVEENADVSNENQKDKTSESAATPLFDLKKKRNKKEFDGLNELKSPLRVPSQFPNESSVVSQYSVDPEDKVRYWLDEAKSSAVPTQDKPVDTPTQSTLISVSQILAKQQQTFKTPHVPQRATELEESQADSIIVCHSSRRKFTVEVNKADSINDSDISMDDGPELFESPAEDYQKRKRNVKGCERNVSIEKPKSKGLGLRKKKVQPIKYDDEDDDSDSRANTVEDKNRSVNLDVSIDDFVEERGKVKPTRQYFNKKSKLPAQVQATDKEWSETQIEVLQVKQGETSKSSNLPMKSTSIVEVASPEQSPSKAENVQKKFGKTPSPGFSRYNKMKSDFMDKRKIQPLDISTSSACRNAPSTKKSVSPKSNEMAIESASEKSEKTSVKQSENHIHLETVTNATNQAEKHNSPSLIENSLPMENSPKDVQFSDLAKARKKAGKSLLPALTIPPTQESIALSLESNNSARRRKTFSLESNTADILGNSPPGQKASQIFSTKSKTPVKRVVGNTVHFLKKGKLFSARGKYAVRFVKLGYLSPIALRKNIKFMRKQFRDVAVQTSPPNPSQVETILAEKSTVAWVRSPLLPEIPIAKVDAEQVDDSSDELDLIEKSQETLKNVFLPRPAKAKDLAPESCQIDSNDIIPASIPIGTQSLKRPIDSSSLSMSLGTESVETLLSLNESEFELQQERSEKPTKRRKFANKIHHENTQSSDQEKKKPTNTEPPPVLDVIKPGDKEMQWTYSSQDAAVRAVAMEDVKYAREIAAHQSLDATCIIESTPNDSGMNIVKAVKKNSQVLQQEIVLNTSTVSKVSAISPFLEESDTLTENEEQNLEKPVEKKQSPVKQSTKERKLVCKESEDEGEEELEVIEGTPKAKRPVAAIRDPVVSFIFTSLAKGKVALIQKFCQTFKKSSVNTSMNPSVTHLVVPHSEDMNTVSTLKFYLAVAKGLWVVSIHWVADCISSGRIIPEEPYEMKNMHGFEGPRKSRLGKGNIFEDFEMYCLEGNYSAVSREQIKDIICCGGGRALKNTKEPQKKKYRLVICATENIDEGALEDSSCMVLMMDWVLESVENYRLASAFNYLPNGVSVTQVSQAQFDLPADMLRFEASDEPMH